MTGTVERVDRGAAVCLPDDAQNGGIADPDTGGTGREVAGVGPAAAELVPALTEERDE